MEKLECCGYLVVWIFLDFGALHSHKTPLATGLAMHIARTMLSQNIGPMSVTRRYCTETAKRIVKVFHSTNVMAIFRRGHPKGGVECRGYEKSRFLTSISLCLGTVQNRAS